MQNQPQIYCKVIFDPQELSHSFPITNPDKYSHSPPTGPISFMHYHNNLEIGYCYKGCGIFFIDGQVLPFSAGASSIIFENQIHIAQSDSKDPSEWKFFNMDPLQLLSDFNLAELESLSWILKKVRGCRNIFDKENFPGISALIYEIILELEECKENYSKIVKTLVYQLMLKLSRECSGVVDNSNLKSFPDMMKISPALKYISDNYSTPFGLEKLAKLCTMSMTNFRRIFKRTMGMSPNDYLHLVRIKMASILLSNSVDSILEVSLKVGYPTLSSFNRQFSSIMNKPPSVWRKSEIRRPY